MTQTDRKIAALAIMALVILGIVAGSQLRADRVTGIAQADWPQPPAPGDCVVLDGDEGVVATPCTEPHDGEVLYSAAATDPDIAAIFHDDAVIDDSMLATEFCTSANIPLLAGFDNAPTPHPTLLTSLSPQAQFTARWQAETERIGGRAWLACIVHPEILQPYTGSAIAALENNSAQIPAEYRSCWDSRDDFTPVSCSQPHGVEAFAAGVIDPATLRGIDIGAAVADDDLIHIIDQSDDGMAVRLERQMERSQRVYQLFGEQEQAMSAEWLERLQQPCFDQVAEQIGVDDPTFGGVLTVTPLQDPHDVWNQAVFYSVTIADDGDVSVETNSGTTTGHPQPGSSIFIVPALVGAARCTVSAPPGQLLTTSLIGWGDDAPLPLINDPH